MKSNTQNKKIEAITEKTLVIGIDVGSETYYARVFDYEVLNSLRNRLNLATVKPVLKCLKHGFLISKKSMKRIRLFQEWNRPDITGLILENSFRITK